MNLDIAPHDRQAKLPHRHYHIARHWPALLAVLAIGGIFALISAPLSPGPRGLLLGLIVALLVPLVISVRHGLVHLSRMLGFVILGLVTCAEAASASFLVINLATQPLGSADIPHDIALMLLRDAALIWIVNILTFALWYWEIDSGGPGRRHREGYHSVDLVFPQLALDQTGERPWCPSFIDYLFLAFNTSTAFSPTDTLVLSRRAKLLFMTQSLISLVVLAIIAARAINTL
ncbi:MAG TPA: hypothetical protein VKE41_01475 [Roseiflexaceae bacterium]|nr:hypothetical protein [Roseiflexaceae bacterium]